MPPADTQRHLERAQTRKRIRDMERHEMTLSGMHPTGAEEWTCPECGKKVVLKWHPFKRIVLVDGEDVEHVASRGGLKIGPVEITPSY